MAACPTTHDTCCRAHASTLSSAHLHVITLLRSWLSHGAPPAMRRAAQRVANAMHRTLAQCEGGSAVGMQDAAATSARRTCMHRNTAPAR